MPERYQFLWVRLQMEQHKLLDWAKIANLSEDDKSLSVGLHLSRHLINDALHQIEALLLDLRGLSTRYKLMLVADGDHPESRAMPPGRSLTAPALGRVPAPGHEMKARAIDLIAKSRRYPARLRWAAFDADKFSKLLADLTALNDNMMYFLESDQKRVAYQLQQASFMRILQVSDKVDQLVGLVSSLEVSSRTSSQTTSATPSESPLGLALVARRSQEQRLVQLARFKALSVAVEQNPDDPRAVSLRQSTTENLEIHADELFGLEPTAASPNEPAPLEARRWYTYRNTGVWVEWKSYIAQGFDSLPPEYVEDRVRKLAALLHNEEKPAEFRVPDCLGYVHQPELERFGYVFRWPKPGQDGKASAGDENSGPPVSLRGLLGSLPYPPPLGTRFAMMRAIATSIWYLHATNWLHKGLRSENVIFRTVPMVDKSATAEAGATTQRPSSNAGLGDPFLSGFEYSRPAEAGERTERPAAGTLYHELYRHPRVQFDLPREAGGQCGAKKTGFRKAYDVYALGVVLLEVALWEPVHALVGLPDESAVTPRAARGAWTALAEEKRYEGRLRAMVGDGVAEAVMACVAGLLVDRDSSRSGTWPLEGGDGDGGEGDDVVLQSALGDKVVKVLDELAV